MYFLKLEPGGGARGLDRLSMHSLDKNNVPVPMSCTFHGGESLQWVLKELEVGLRKYNEWKVLNLPVAEVESRMIEVGP